MEEHISYRLKGYYSGFWMHPAFFGHILCLSTPFIIGKLFIAKSNLLKGFWGLTLVTAGFLCLLTSVRIIAITFFIILFSFLYRYYLRDMKSRRALFIPIILLCLLLLFVYANFAVHSNYSPFRTKNILERFVLKDKLDIRSIEYRFMLYGDAWALFKEHPVFGIGRGCFYKVYGSYGTGVHNFFLEFLAETGIAGTLLLLWILTTFIFRNCKLAARIRNNPALYYAVFSLIFSSLSFWLAGLTGVVFNRYQFFLFFWLMQGILTAVWSRDERF
jgi:O-antigen ligase